MIRDTFSIIALAILFVAAFVAVEAMSAEQTTPEALSPTIATALIPFDFWIGDSYLPAGEYRVYFIFGLTSVILLRNATNGAQEKAFLVPIDGQVSRDDLKLIFATRNGENFLHEIWKADGRSIVTSEFAVGDKPGDTQSEVPLRTPGTTNSMAGSE